MKISKTNISGFLCSMLCATASLLFSPLMTSCSEDDIEMSTSGPRAGYLTIKLSNSKLETRATEAGINDLNENKIGKVLVCLFPDGYTNDSYPAYQTVVECNNNNTAEVSIKLTKEIINSVFPARASGYVYVLANMEGNVPEGGTVPGDDSRLTLSEIRDLAIQSDFKNTAIQASFVMDGDCKVKLEGNASNPKDAIVSLDVAEAVELQRVAAKVTLGVKIAENTVDKAGNTWTPVFTQDGTQNAMRASITNGVYKSKVQPNPEEGIKSEDYDKYYYSTPTTQYDTDNNPIRYFVDTEETGEDAFPYVLNKPFYTYPTKWSDNQIEDFEDGQPVKYTPYLTLMIPWKTTRENPTTGSEEEVYRTCYYAIPMLQDGNELVRNVAYKININVNILGSFKPDQPVELEDASYCAVDWGSAPVDVDIKDYRYLVLDQTAYYANNVNSFNVPFYSSHETMVVSKKMEYTAFNLSAAGITQTITVSEAVADASVNANDKNTPLFTAEVNNKTAGNTATRTVTVEHELVQWIPQRLNNNGTPTDVNLTPTNGYNSNIQTYIEDIYRYRRPENPDASYCEYVITVTIAHADKVTLKADGSYSWDPKYAVEFVIHQYPAMYIEAVSNEYIMYRDEPYGSVEFGNVYINGNDDNTANMTPSGLTGGNRNPNMYVITTTQLSSSRYIIGDPRQTTSTTLDYTNWKQGYNLSFVLNNNNNFPTPPYTQGMRKTLTNYYPTLTDDTKKFYIAPKLRVASSYGVSPTMNQQTAQQRCASYQELDCPAGRWRLPTYGELEYIINLSNNGKIPILFSDNSDYWCAQGAAKGKVDSNGYLVLTSGNSHVRCVYDEWYWGDSKVPKNGTKSVSMRPGNTTQTRTVDYYPFTWGDWVINFPN